MLNTPWPSEGGTFPDKDETGRRGERVAARWLWTRGCRVLYRNYRAPGGGELDVVCRDGDTLAFVEVKTRTSTAFGRPAQAVNLDKQALILRGADAWLRMLDHAADIPWRCDVVEVLLIAGQKPAVNWIRHAFHSADVRAKLGARRHR